MKKGQRISDGEHRIEFKCNNDEYYKLHQLTQNNGVTRTQILRNLINNKKEPLMSFEEVRKYYEALNKIGNNINQISAKYNTMGFLDIKGLQKQLDEVGEVNHSLFMLLMTGELGNGKETADWKKQVSKILKESKNPADFLAIFWQKSSNFYKK